jgi:hypothetical protein
MAGGAGRRKFRRQKGVDPTEPSFDSKLSQEHPKTLNPVTLTPAPAKSFITRP